MAASDTAWERGQGAVLDATWSTASEAEHDEGRVMHPDRAWGAIVYVRMIV